MESFRERNTSRKDVDSYVMGGGLWSDADNADDGTKDEVFHHFNPLSVRCMHRFMQGR